jgi:FkbM family methyltransferase
MLGDFISQIIKASPIYSVTLIATAEHEKYFSPFQSKYPFQEKHLHLSECLQSKIYGDLAVISLSENDVEEYDILNVISSISNFPNVLVMFEFNFEIGNEKNDLQKSNNIRKNFLENLSNDYFIKSLTNISKRKPLDAIFHAQKLNTVLAQEPIRQIYKTFDEEAQERKIFHTVPSQPTKPGEKGWLVKPQDYNRTELTKELDEIKPFIKKKRHVIDVGARHGQYTRACLNDGFAKVSSFELVEIYREAFFKNVDTDKVDLYNVGVYAKTMLIHFNGRAGKGIQQLGTELGQQVFSIDDFNLKDVDLIKIDVDGCDRQVLRGARRTIEKYFPVVQIECSEMQLRYDPEDLKNLEDIYQWLINDFGYKVGKQGHQNTILYHSKYV